MTCIIWSNAGEEFCSSDGEALDYSGLEEAKPIPIQINSSIENRIKDLLIVMMPGVFILCTWKAKNLLMVDAELVHPAKWKLPGNPKFG